MSYRSFTFIGASLVIAAAGTSAHAIVTHTYDFNDASLFVNVGPLSGPTFFTGGAGGGFFPRSGGGWPGQPGVTTAPETGAMRYTSTTTGFGGARLFLVEGDMSNYRNNTWAPEMTRANNPYVSVDVFNGGGSGDITFYTAAANTPSTTFGVGLTGFAYRGITVKSGTGTVNAGGGTADVAMASGWNNLAMQLTAAGTLNYYLNGVNFRSVANASGSGGLQHEYLMDAWDSAAGFYSNGASSGLFDNFVVGNNIIIPTPGALALLGMGGLVATRRRRR